MRLKSIVLLIFLSFVFRLDVAFSAASYDPNFVCADPSLAFSPDYGNNRTFAEAWQYVRSAWASWPECTKGPIKYILNSSGNAYKFWYCVSYGQWCDNISYGPSPVTTDIGNCNNNGQTRHYTGQQYFGNINNMSGVSSDANLSCIPYASQECEAVMVQVQCCPEGSVAWYVDMTNNTMFYVTSGVTDCVPFPEQWLDGVDYSTPVPTPTPPVPTPTPPPPTPPVSTPTPPQATPTPLSSPTPPPYPGYTPAPPVVYSTPVYSSTVVPTPDNDGTVLDSNIDDIEYNSQVPDVGQDLEEDDSWLDTIFNLFSNHPLVDVIKGSKLTTSGELCSLSVNLYGSVIEISFCNLVDYVEIFGYFVTVCASIYAYFIIFRVS